MLLVVMTQADFTTTVGKRLRPQAIDAIVEVAEHALLWGRILALHYLKLLVAWAGIDPDIIRVVSFMEKWVWIASFTVFFFRVLIRLRRFR